jgi:hypothetical protein
MRENVRGERRAAVRTAWQWPGAFALWGYAALPSVIALPPVLKQSVLWQFSLYFLAIAAVPTVVLGLLLLVPRLARVSAVLAVLWMLFLAWSLRGGPPALVALVVAILLGCVAEASRPRRQA